LLPASPVVYGAVPAFPWLECHHQRGGSHQHDFHMTGPNHAPNDSVLRVATGLRLKRTHIILHMHPYNGHFPGKHGLASCPFIFLTRGLERSFTGQMPLQVPPSRNALAGITSSASTMTLEEEGTSLPMCLWGMLNPSHSLLHRPVWSPGL